MRQYCPSKYILWICQTSLPTGRLNTPSPWWKLNHQPAPFQTHCICRVFTIDFYLDFHTHYLIQLVTDLERYKYSVHVRWETIKESGLGFLPRSSQRMENMDKVSSAKLSCKNMDYSLRNIEIVVPWESNVAIIKHHIYKQTIQPLRTQPIMTVVPWIIQYTRGKYSTVFQRYK